MESIPLREGFKHCLDAESFASRNYKIFFVKNYIDKSRLGVVVPKRYIPKSVDRNFSKRVIREIFRSRKIKYICFDVVVLARKITPRDSKAHKQELNYLFNRVEELCV